MTPRPVRWGALCARLVATFCVGACTREQAGGAAAEAIVSVGKAVLADDGGMLEMIELDTVGPAHHGRRIKVHGYVMRDTIEIVFQGKRPASPSAPAKPSPRLPLSIASLLRAACSEHFLQSL